MKYLLILPIILLSCCQQKTNVDEVKTDDGRSIYRVDNSHDIEEVEIKGHLYLITRVHNGYTIAHAGHCPRTHE